MGRIMWREKLTPEVLKEWGLSPKALTLDIILTVDGPNSYSDNNRYSVGYLNGNLVVSESGIYRSGKSYAIRGIPVRPGDTLFVEGNESATNVQVSLEPSSGSFAYDSGESALDTTQIELNSAAKAYITTAKYELTKAATKAAGSLYLTSLIGRPFVEMMLGISGKLEGNLKQTVAHIGQWWGYADQLLQNQWPKEWAPPTDEKDARERITLFFEAVIKYLDTLNHLGNSSWNSAPLTVAVNTFKALPGSFVKVIRYVAPRAAIGIGTIVVVLLLAHLVLNSAGSKLKLPTG